MERASRGRAGRTRNVSLKDDPVLFAMAYGDRHGGQKSLCIGMPAVIVKFSGIRKLHNITKVHDCDPVTHVLNDRKIMRDENIGQFLFSLKILQKVQYLCLYGNVQRRDRFIEHDDLGVYAKRPGDADPLALSGPAYVRIENDEYLAGEDSLCIIHPYEYHTYLRPKDPEQKYELATIAFSIKNLAFGKYEGLDVASAVAALNRTYKLSEMKETLWPLFMELDAEIKNRQPGYTAVLKDILKTLLLRIFRAVLPSKVPESGLPEERTRAILIDRFYTLNYNSQVSITELAGALNVSERRTNQLIHELYGCSFSDKLSRTRIEVAKLLLSYSDYGIAEISAACGFPSLNFFYKTFRRHNYCSPGEYRRNFPGRFTDKVTYTLCRSE